MYTEIAPEEAEGKVFQTLVWGHDGDVIVAFQDETFFYLKARHWYDYTCLEVENWNKDDFANHALVEAGLASQEEVDQWDRERKATWNERQKAERLAQYERLKKEFENQ